MIMMIFSTASILKIIFAIGRVICAILGVSHEEQSSIMDSICKMTPALVASSSLETLSNNIYNSLESLFS